MCAIKNLSAKPYLIDITLLREKVPSWNVYPFSLPVVRNLTTLQFHPAVTFFIGENGTGKSTLLEAIAQLLRYNPEGGNKNTLFSTRETHSNLCNFLRKIEIGMSKNFSSCAKAKEFGNKKCH